MLTVVCFLWGDGPIYTPDSVFKLRKMVRDNLNIPHEFKCMTDNEDQFKYTDMLTGPLDMRYNTFGDGECTTQLFVFHPDSKELIGERFLYMDLDCLVVGNMDKVAGRTEPLVLWHNPRRVPTWESAKCGREWYNGSIMLMDGGTRPDIWENFGEKHPSPQKWMSKCIGPDAPYWDKEDGVYRLEAKNCPGSGIDKTLPGNAAVVFFPGSQKPHLPEVQQRAPWVRDYL